MEPFLRNHQCNRIVQQASVVLTAVQTSTDRKVIEAAKASALSKAIAACGDINQEQQRMIERIVELRTTEEFQAFTNEIAAVTVPFPKLTEKEIRALYPKIKKLRIPELDRLEGKPLTYLGWTDAATNRMFLVYPSADSSKLVGIEGRFTPTSKKGVCAFCSRSSDTMLFTAVSKAKIAHLPDYYKALGQYICQDSIRCNSRITTVDILENYVQEIAGT